MNRYLLFGITARSLVGLLLIPTAFASVVVAGDRPAKANVVLILADDHQW